MKKTFKIIWFAIASLALSGLIFYLSLFLAWGRIIDVQFGAIVAILVGIIFFSVMTLKVIDEKEIQKEQQERTIVSKGFRLLINTLIFLLPFYILSFYFIPQFHYWNGTYLKLYRYSDYPCKSQTFTTNDKMILLTHHDGMLPRSAYYLSHNTLNEIKEGQERDYYNRFVYVPKGTKFQVIGFYMPIDRGSGTLQYFLVESLDKDKTKAWIDQYSFNVKICYPEEVPYYKESSFYAPKGTHGEENVDLSNMKILP